MDRDRSTDETSPNPPMTEAQIIAATVGPRQPFNSTVYLAPYDPAWPARFAQLAAGIRGALGNAVLLQEHVGATAVPGLSAKPIIDMVLAVADARDKAAYVKPLEAVGYVLPIPALPPLSFRTNGVILQISPTHRAISFLVESVVMSM